ncbi:hypothetical protein KP79_PYT18817 [Mizuhopecten yessoensis]|uniref:Mutator-like transposase domain-containing protein n=1 Tax=Mizuhopecten yessoensis TaxID=6573 RepID=A0A210Q3A5_MIZYE|nr:hypothetical protein KP79_PYT18817 [Mizuhopecten yessoensis]
MSKASMESLREKIVADNTTCGLEKPDLINAEMDGRYNNPLFSGDRTPYQGATQVTMTLCEQMTSDKKILSVFTGSKLCKRAEYLRRCGVQVTCPNHTGICTANVAEDAAIGNEEAWATIVGEEIADTLKINYLTTDGDSKTHTGMKKSHPACKNLKDPRHLVKSVKREFWKSTFSADLFQKFRGLPYGTLKSRLATDVRNRCVTELERAHIVHKGNLDQIKKNMPMTIEAMIQCYKGNCAEMCAEFSYCCQGLPDNHWSKTFLPQGIVLCLSAKDEHHFKQCVLKYLSTECLDSTKLLTSTQKCESFNRVLQKTNPKMMTCYRNFPARIHTAIHLCNFGIADSTVLRLRAVGSPLVSGSRVVSRITNLRKRQLYHQQRQRNIMFKLKRGYHRIRRYRMHAKARVPTVTYKSGVDDRKTIC